MKRLIIAFALAGLALSIGSCQEQQAKDNRTGVKEKPGKYFCTMDTAITSNQPGLCSKCGMELVAREADSK